MRHLAISISGGGILGIGPLAFMARMENDYKVNLSDLPSAFAGTSTGAIVASMLNEGMCASGVYGLYKKYLGDIFTKYPWYKRILPTVPKYDNGKLTKLLKSYLRGNCSDWDRPIYIPATHMNGKYVEKVWDLGDDMPKWFAVLTSTAAPTYFDVIVDDDGNSYMDGGMWANNPVAVLNAGLNKSGMRGDVKILSFDTGMMTPNTASGNKTLLGWGKYILEEYVARTTLSGDYEVAADIGRENVFLAAPSAPKAIKMDDTSESTVDGVIAIWNQYYDMVKPQLDEFMAR